MTDTRSLSDIFTEIQLDILRRNPKICDWTALSVIRTIVEAFSVQYYQIEQLIKDTENGLFINTATGEKLDNLVVDRLPAGRQPGTKATGQLTFSCNTVAPTSILIPAGTEVSMPMPDSIPVYFQTTVDATIPQGETSITVDAEAEEAGVAGNAVANAIIKIKSSLTWVNGVTNPLPFENGTDEESDDDLRKRYIYAVEIPGRATKSMIEQHLYDLESVFEAKCFNVSPGEVELIVDCASIFNPAQEISDTIISNLAAGVVAKGLLAATLSAGGNAQALGTSAGGYIWVRPEQNIVNAEAFSLDYTDHLGRPRTAAVNIPSGTPKGYAILAELEDSGDRAVSIPSTPEVLNSYTVLIGQGDYPYLFNLPERVPVSVSINLRLTDTPEVGLSASIKSSIEAYLGAFAIGEDLEYSDLIEYIRHDYTTGERFVGIQTILGVTVVGNLQTLTGFNQTISIDNDQRICSGAVSINVIA